MPITESQINATLEKVYASKDESAIQEAANELLLDTGIKPGAKVAVIEDDVYGYDGCTGTVKGPTAGKTGFVDVQMANGTTVPLISTLLVSI